MAKLVLVHWDAAEAEAWRHELMQRGWEVDAESEDPARAYRRIRDWRPDVVAVTLRARSDEGVRLAESVRHTPWGREIPFVFVGGNDDDALLTLRGMFAEASFVEADELVAAVDAHRQKIDG